MLGVRGSARFQPAAAVAVLVLVAWLACGVHLTEIARFVGYELGYVLVPGVIVVALLTPRRRLSIPVLLFLGYVVGITIELAAFTFTAAIDKRAGLPLFPLPAYALGLLALLSGHWRLRVPRASGTPAMRGYWVGAGVAAAVVVCLTMGFFISNPLARTVDSVAYDQDLVYHLSLAAEAKNQWPMKDPNISGESLRYHTFANRDMAAVSRVTGIPLDVILLRLMPVAMLLALGVGVALLTRRLGGSVNTAALAVALALLAGELDVDTKIPLPFLGGSLLVHLQSPSFYLGAVFFLGALYVLIELLGAPRSPGWLAILAIILGGVSGAKANVIPMLIGGSALLLVRDLARTRRLKVESWLPLGLLGLAFVVSYVLLYKGGQGHGFDVLPLHFGRAIWPDASPIGAALIDAVAIVAILPSLLGLIGFAVLRGRSYAPAELLLVCTFLTGLVVFYWLAQPGGAEVYFLLYGALAAMPLCAVGVAALWDRLLAGGHRRVLAMLIAAAAVLAACATGAAVLGSRTPPKPSSDLLAAWSLVLCAVVLAGLVYRKELRRERWPTALLSAALPLILVVSFLDYPLDTGSRLVSRWSRGKPAWQQSVPGVESGMTRELRSGLLWLRDHTRKSAVVAVNNQFIDPGFSRYFYYAAFGERRTFIGGWEYSERAAPVLKGGQLPSDLAARAQLSWSAALGAPQALHVLASSGVAYLLVDKVNAQSGDAAKVDAIIRPAFENNAVAIYSLAGL